MDGISRYLIGLIGTAMIGTLAVELIGEKRIAGRLVKLISSILLTLVAVSPLLGAKLSIPDYLFQDTATAAQQFAQQGIAMAEAENRAIIKSGLEAYILDKAAAYNIDITVEVTLSDDDLPIPVAVQIVGESSPYAKACLTQFMEKDLAIPEENMRWN